MTSPMKSIWRWIATLNSVDDPGETSIHRFILSARLGLWPAIFLGAFAFRHLLGYAPDATITIAVDLCLIASVAFLFNDVADAAIDAANKIHRWNMRSRLDLQMFAIASGV